jgi:hypothetical protein
MNSFPVYLRRTPAERTVERIIVVPVATIAFARDKSAIPIDKQQRFSIGSPVNSSACVQVLTNIIWWPKWRRWSLGDTLNGIYNDRHWHVSTLFLNDCLPFVTCVRLPFVFVSIIVLNVVYQGNPWIFPRHEYSSNTYDVNNINGKSSFRSTCSRTRSSCQLPMRTWVLYERTLSCRFNMISMVSF